MMLVMVLLHSHTRECSHRSTTGLNLVSPVALERPNQRIGSIESSRVAMSQNETLCTDLDIALSQAREWECKSMTG